MKNTEKKSEKKEKVLLSKDVSDSVLASINDESITEKNDELAVELLAATPGHQLKALREGLGLSLEDIKRKTNILIVKLEMLEDDEYERCGPAVFVSGYIRSYANAVNGDAEALVAAYREINLGPVPYVVEVADASGAIKQEPSDIKDSIRFVQGFSVGSVALVAGTGVIVLIVVLLLLFTGRADEELVERHALNGSAQSVTESHEALEDTSVSNIQVNSIPEDSNNTLPVSESGVLFEEPVSASITSSRATIEPQADAQAVATNESLVAEDGDSSLAFEFSADCWVKIEDANGTVIFAELKSKGDNLHLFGQAPFKVLLGDARAASLLLDGRAVEISPQANKKTIKFTVEPWSS